LRAVNFSTILFEGIQLAGQDRHNLSDETFAQFRDFANQRLRMAWESQDWPDLVRVAQFTVDGTTGTVTAAIPADAGEVLNCYDQDPLLTPKAQPLSYRIYNDGSVVKLVFGSDPSTVWGEYRVKKPELFGDVWKSSLAYSVGAQAYFDSGSATGTTMPIPGKPHYGDFWECVEATTAGQSPITHPAKWARKEIPYIFGTFVSRGMYADWLRSELQIEAAQIAEQEAQAMLDLEIDKIFRQQKQSIRINMVRTY
jgi:hypothetical protein